MRAFARPTSTLQWLQSTHRGRVAPPKDFCVLAKRRSLITGMDKKSDTSLLQNKANSYEEAVQTLNSLQTNAAVLAAVRKERGRMQRTSLPEMASFLSRLGLKVEDLDKLNAIHVSGTKGKGSTCAFVESILRHSGFKTGLYTSPHLVEVRERIQINGRPISRDMFSKYFFECYYKLLGGASECSEAMPGYFRFLTLLAFYIFLFENVDVAVIEVGIGGSYDCTNILQSPIVCGISLLGLDHTSVLGDTIQQIAWHKAGIMKKGRPAVTIPQNENALSCLFDRSFELHADLSIAPPFSDYCFSKPLGVQGVHQYVNASLAVQLCRLWMTELRSRISDGMHNINLISFPEFTDVAPSKRNDQYPVCASFMLPQSFQNGLTSVVWPGRCQVVSRPNVTIYLDGAHTKESMEACVTWFQEKMADMQGVDSCCVLMFNLSLDRNPDVMYKSLKKISWHHAVFCPSLVTLEEASASSSDSTNYTVDRNEQLAVCLRNEHAWRQACAQLLHGACSTSVFSCIGDAIKWIVNGRDPSIGRPSANGPSFPDRLLNAEHVSILVTGSLHLVGGVLRYLGPDIS